MQDVNGTLGHRGVKVGSGGKGVVGGFFIEALSRNNQRFLKKSSFEWPLILSRLNYALSFRWNMVELITQKYFRVTFWMPGFRDAPDPYLLMSGSVAG